MDQQANLPVILRRRDRITQLLGKASRCVYIRDRESDIYELFSTPQAKGTSFLLTVTAKQTISATMEDAKVKAVHQVEVRDGKGCVSWATVEAKCQRLAVFRPMKPPYLWLCQAPLNRKVDDAPKPGSMIRRPCRIVLFDCQMFCGREVPTRTLRELAWILQTGGYAAYEEVGVPVMVHAACWVNGRRKFVMPLKRRAKDTEAARVVSRIDAVFANDAEVRDAGMIIDQRHALRPVRAAALLAGLREE